MSRSPLPAWRRLFAAGGAPAAAHAALSRAPAPERLLEPMARMRLAADTSLDALAKPLDISSVLARVLEGMPVAQKVMEEGDAPERARNGARRVDAQKSVSRARSVDGTAAASVPRTANRLPSTPPPPRKHIVASVSDGSHAVSRRSAPQENVSFSTKLPESTAAARTTIPFAHRRASLDVRAGGNARVIVDAPVEGIERLLAIGDPSAVPARRHASTAQTNGPAMEPSASDAARTLAGAVDRVAARRATSASPVAQRGEPRWHQPVHTETLITERQPSDANRTAESVTAVVNDASSNGGFRGLARRTLVANGAAQHLPVRLEPEARTPSDLPLDNLDARVAESLARILEREARRHGVDLAESRT